MFTTCVWFYIFRIQIRQFILFIYFFPQKYFLFNQEFSFLNSLVQKNLRIEITKHTSYGIWIIHQMIYFIYYFLRHSIKLQFEIFKEILLFAVWQRNLEKRVTWSSSPLTTARLIIKQRNVFCLSYRNPNVCTK